MKTHSQTSLNPRKRPVQARSGVTVAAILEATIQVLLSHGAERLTTTRVAERAGVSVGTLYQYYSNKRSLLFAVLERHLASVVIAVERAFREHHYRPLATMVGAVVRSFVDAKLARKDASLALYAVAPDLDGEALTAKLTRRAQTAISYMLRTGLPLVSPRSNSQSLCFSRPWQA